MRSPASVRDSSTPYAGLSERIDQFCSGPGRGSGSGGLGFRAGFRVVEKRRLASGACGVRGPDRAEREDLPLATHWASRDLSARQSSTSSARQKAAVRIQMTTKAPANTPGHERRACLPSLLSALAGRTGLSSSSLRAHGLSSLGALLILLCSLVTTIILPGNNYPLLAICTSEDCSWGEFVIGIDDDDCCKRH